jgi:hypothetical protein
MYSISHVSYHKEYPQDRDFMKRLARVNQNNEVFYSTCMSRTNERKDKIVLTKK